MARKRTMLLRSLVKIESSGIVFIVWVLACLSGPSLGYPNGKVKEACNSMKPLHGHSPQKYPKHTIEVNVTEFKPGDHVKASGLAFLSGSSLICRCFCAMFCLTCSNWMDQSDFAPSAQEISSSLGTACPSMLHLYFDMMAEGQLGIQVLLANMNVTRNSAVSHTSKSKKTRMDAYWIAPRDAPKRVQFLVTVVEKYSIFWVKIPGPTISQPNTPILTTTIGTVPTSSLDPHLTQPFNASDCGSKKFCVRNPSNCDPQASNCFFLSFRRDHGSVLVEMSGASEGYIAFALSHDQWMGGGDDAYICISENHHVDISTASLAERAYPEFDDSEDALEEMSWRLADGFIQCSFKRRIHLPAFKGRFNLDANYYIFLADGEVDEGDTIQKHHRQPLITNAKYNVSGPPKDIGGSRSPFLIKIHGALMFVAWMTTVSIGVLVARFFKPVWPNSLLFGAEIWFQVHRMLMMTTVLLTSASFVLPFVYRGGWSEQAGFHPYLGCTVMALAIFQPLMAGFRPPPQAPRRQLFNWLHWSTGTTARILAVITMFLGMDLPTLNLPDPWDTYTMMGFVAWHVGIDLLLEIHGYCLIRKVEVLEDDRIQILQSITTAEAQGHTFKKTVLFLYICGNIVFLITFLTAIVQV